MSRLNQKVILNVTAQAATTTVDFDMPDGADGCIAEVVTANGASTPSFTFSLGRLSANSDGTYTHTSLITSAAVTTNTATRVGVVPGVVAQANIFANEPMGPKGRFTVTRSTGNADIYVTLTFYKFGV